MAEAAVAAGRGAVLPNLAPARRVRLVTLAVVLVAWEILAYSGLLYEGVVPPLESMAIAFVRLLFSAGTYRNLGATAWEVGVGFPIGFVVGVALGLWMGVWPLFGRAVTPYVDGLATAPKIIFFPIAMLAFGTGMESKIALGALSCFFPVVINAAAGMREINPVWVRVGRSFNLTRRQMVTRVYLPALKRPIVTGMRLGLGLTVIAVLLGEIKMSDRGLGFMANEAYNHFRVPELYAILVLIFMLAVGSNRLIGRLLPVR